MAGTKAVRGRPGLNTVRLNGRFNGRMLRPGTYGIVVVAQRGSTQRRVGSISVQVVPPGRHLRRESRPPVFRCVPALTELAQVVMPGADLFQSPPAKTGDAPPSGSPAAKPAPRRSGVLAAPPFHLGTGSGVWDLVLAILIYGTMGIGGAVLLVYVVRFLRGTWNP